MYFFLFSFDDYLLLCVYFVLQKALKVSVVVFLSPYFVYSLTANTGPEESAPPFNLT